MLSSPYPSCGDIMTMPGLAKVPVAEKIDIDDKGKVVGLSCRELCLV